MRGDLWRRRAFAMAPLASAMGYGTWAGLVNHLAGNPSWPLIFASHGAYAFTLTLFGDRLTRRLSRRLSEQKALGLMTALTVFLPLAIQLALGNRRIGLSLAPGLVIGQLFLIAVLIDERSRRRADSCVEVE